MCWYSYLYINLLTNVSIYKYETYMFVMFALKKELVPFLLLCGTHIVLKKGTTHVCFYWSKCGVTVQGEINITYLNVVKVRWNGVLKMLIDNMYMVL